MEADPLLGQVLADRYRVDELIGGGGMARVYLAEQLSMARQVALKVLNTELLDDAEATARFRREVEAVTRLQSPHTISFIDFGETPNGLLFIAMELLDGETLRARLSREGTVPVDDAIAIVAQIANSLGEAHSAGVVHRDLKPENVQFASYPSPIQPFLKVLDFGLARVMEPAEGGNITGMHKTVGTPAYLAPEVAIKGGVADWRADLYALGVMAFEMLTGERPYDDKSPTKVILAHINAPIPSIAERRPDLRPEVDAFIQIAMAKKPEDRSPNAQAFYDSFAASLR
jgi:serine/threonine protein kinase